MLRKKMAFLAKIAVSGKGGPLGKMAVLADFQDLRGAGYARILVPPVFPLLSGYGTWVRPYAGERDRHA